MNAYNLETNKTDEPEEKKRIAAKQLRIAEFFRKLANKIAIDNKQSEVKATKDIVSSNKKLTSKDVLDSAPDSAASVLF